MHDAIAKFKYDVVLLYTHNFDLDLGVLRHHMYASQVANWKAEKQEAGGRG